jgi:toxic protein SymE
MQYSDRRTPTIHLKDKWLDDASFSTGTALNVRVMPGCLVITTEEANITKSKQLLKQIQQTQEHISEAATTLYNSKIS